MDRTRKIAAATLATGILVVGVLVPAVARESDAETESGSDGDAVDRRMDRRAVGPDMAHDERRAAHHTAFAEALAAELDLDTDTVARAIDAVRDQMRTEHHEERRAELEQRLADAVEEGNMSQEQADAMEDALDDGVLPFRGGAEGRGMLHRLDRDELRGLGRDGGRHGWGDGHGPGKHSPFSDWDPDDDPEPAA